MIFKGHLVPTRRAPKRGGNIPFNASCAGLSPSNSSILTSAFRWILWDETALTRDHRSALGLKSMQVVEKELETGLDPPRIAKLLSEGLRQCFQRSGLPDIG